MFEGTLAASSVRTAWFDRATSSLFHVGRVVFSLAIVALGVETLVCARYVTDGLGPQYKVIPVLPWLPAIPWLAYLFGAILVACGAGLLNAGVRCGPFPCPHGHRRAIARVDSVARVLGRVFRSGIHRRRLEHRLQLLATVGRRRCRVDVRDLGRDITSAQSPWALRHTGRAAQSRRVVKSIIAVALWGGLWALARNAEA